MAVLRSEAVDAFSQFLGWCYFIAWSISFWPQTILNFKRKSVSGLSLDFQLYNLTGFLFYTVYCITKYVEDQRLGVVQSVEPNDIAFGVHAVVVTLLCLYQFRLFPASGNTTLTGLHSWLISIFWVLTSYNLILVLAQALPFYAGSATLSQAPGSRFSFIDWLGYGKTAISFIKYTPQAWLNYQRKSTVGWSIVNILLDFTGGALSFSQQLIDAWNRDDGAVIWGNVPKLVLAMESMAFDVLFMVQHYVLYTDRTDPALGGSRGGGQGGEERLLKKEAQYGSSSSSADHYTQLHSPINGVHGDDEEKKEAHVSEVQL